MKYQTEIIINLPIKEVVEKLDSFENLRFWQKGYTHHEHVSGTPGEVGAISKLFYKLGKRSMVLTETVTKRNFPDEFHGTYETDGVLNKQENYFTIVDDNTTKWVSKTEFIFSNFKMKVFGFLMPGAFKKQSLSFLKAFKDFAENGTNVNS